MTKIIHLITSVSGGGAARAMFGVIKYSAQLNDFQHEVISLSSVPESGLALAESLGIVILDSQDRDVILQAIKKADLVHLHFWNNAQLYEFLRSDLPAMRLLIWFHVTGYTPPQVIIPSLVNFADFALAGSNYAYEHPVFQNLPADLRLHKTAMVDAGADFERLSGMEPKPHANFNVGYIGNVTFAKGHPHYVPMSAKVDVPNVKFIVCGGKGQNDFQEHAQQLGVTAKFDFRGYVEDIKSVIEILDVYGYPISPHTSAGSELNLQEAMYGGIPPVVFPYANLKWIVEDHHTGLVVHSELEYQQAIEYLYHHPQERARLGKNARKYAQENLGAFNSVQQLQLIYRNLLKIPKRKRQWGLPVGINLLQDPVKLEDLTSQQSKSSGAEFFIEALGDTVPEFAISMNSQNIEEILEAEAKIALLPATIYKMAGGIRNYRGHYDQDYYLRFWWGLLLQTQNKHTQAITQFNQAINLGFIHWRIYWYLANSQAQVGNLTKAQQALNKVIAAEPGFNPAQQMRQNLSVMLPKSTPLPTSTPKRSLRIVALLTIRNEQMYLARCLEHLYEQGIETCLIDNGSTDNSLKIAETFRNRGVFQIEHLPFNGTFELEKVLLNEEKLAQQIDADWFIHHDADEIRQAPPPYNSLREGIEAVDAQGYNAINFDEFVFLPTTDTESFEGQDYVEQMSYYYFFQPIPLRRVNAWKKTVNIDLHSSGGHKIKFENQKIFPTNFILRHYIFLSKAHGLGKYLGRVYSVDSIKKKNVKDPRLSFNPSKFSLPNKQILKQLKANHWDTSDPWRVHNFLGKSCSTFSLPISSSQQVTESYAPMPFIIGASRSGTTLLRLMLDAHPDLSIPPETHFIPNLLKLSGSSQNLREKFYQRLITDQRWQDFHLSDTKLYQHLAEIEPFTIPQALRCFYKLYADRFGKQRWGDKTPPYIFQIQNIQAILPEAHFIHLIRDGRDVAVSLKNLWWGAKEDVQAQACEWVFRIGKARQQAKFCPHYLEVHYEKLIQNPTQVLQQICEFLSLSYHPAMENYYQTAETRLLELSDRCKPDGTVIATKEQRLAIHRYTYQPPNLSRIGSWREEMSYEDRIRYEAIAGSWLEDLGYETLQSQDQITTARLKLQAIKTKMARSQNRLQAIRDYINSV